MTTQHRLEKRATMLASRMRSTSDGLRAQIAEPGDRPPFTEAMTRTESLDWWAAHRHDQYGSAVLSRMNPVQIAQLDADLSAHINGGGYAPTTG